MKAVEGRHVHQQLQEAQVDEVHPQEAVSFLNSPWPQTDKSHAGGRGFLEIGLRGEDGSFGRCRKAD